MSTLPTASFVTAPVSVCAGSTGVVYNVTNDPTVAYAWNYSGTGAVINNSTTNNVTLDFSNTATSGNLTVITTKNGCSSSSSVSVTVKSKPAAPTQFSTVQNVVCQGMSGVQYGVAASAGVTYNWSYSGTGVNLNSTTNTVGVDFTGTATSGTLSVKSVLNGCESTPLTTAVTVIPIASTIKPDFTIPSVCASSTALFTNTTDPATANISSFAWDFGNGQTATTKNGTATYSTAGVYAVKLTATVTACPSITGSITKNITVLNPTAGIAYDTITAVRGVPVNLSARNIGTTYSWSPVTGLSFPNSASTSLVPTQTQRFLINITAAPLPVAITKLNFFRVYNRWGNIVYEQRNTMGAGIGWNGKYKGIDQPVGVYIWVAEGVDIDNKIVRVDGNTVLIR
jgi:hypothetical protein